MAEKGEIVNGAGTEKEREQLVTEAKQLEDEIMRGIRAVYTAWLYVAQRAQRFIEERMWERLGYESQNQWLASPEVEQSRSYLLAITGVYRTLVIERNVPVDELQGIDLRKLQMALPKVKDGKVRWQDAVADARALGRDDMSAKYVGTTPPEDKARCPTCDSMVPRARLEEQQAA